MTCPFCREPVASTEEAVQLHLRGTAHRRCRDASRAQIHAARTRPTVKADLSQAERCARCGFPDVGGLCDLDGEGVCSGCLLISRGLSPFQGDHPVGQKNADDVILIPANLHAYKTRRGRTWPKALETNITRDPLLVIAANVAAYRDYAAYAATYFGSYLDYLIGLQNWLSERFGERWWEQTDLQALWTERQPVPARDSTGGSSGDRDP
jgi:hypothetical protein